MPSWNNREDLIHQTIALDRQGMGKRAIARALGVSRATVRKIVTAHGEAREEPHTALPVPPPRAPRETKLTPFAKQITDLLGQYVDITAQRVFEELHKIGYEGGYTAVKAHMRKVRPPKKPEPSLPTPVYGPGEMAQSDWTPCVIDLRSGDRLAVQVFGYALAWSRRKSFLIYERADLFALMDGHEATFQRFQGVASACKYDCQKAVVLGWEGRQPLYNPRFLAFATHYEFRPVACRPGKPNDKPVIERSFLEFQRSFLNGRSFRDLTDFRKQLAEWERDVCDLRVHKKLKRPILEMFNEEAPHLLPLPRHPYDTARVVYRVCSVDGFVAWDGNRYAVPYEAIYDILPVRVTQHEILVYAADLRLLARHELAPRSAGHDVGGDAVHRRAERPGANLEGLRESFEHLGEEGADFFADLVRIGVRQGSHHARQILLLRERFRTEDLHAALRHARAFGAFDHHAVARILEARATPRTLAEYVASETAQRLEARLGHRETAPRDLAEYDQLPSIPSLITPEENETCPRNQTPSPPTPVTSSSGCDDTSKGSD